MYEQITRERLDNFAEITKEYERLLEKKQFLLIKVGTVHGVDYSKTKVMSGNAKPTTEQERYAQALFSVNEEIRKYEAFLKPEREIITIQISRVKKKNYRSLLVWRYIEKWKWSEIVREFFETKEDYEDQKHYKYRDTLMYWNRRALEELAKVSSKPYIQASRQLVLGE